MANNLTTGIVQVIDNTAQSINTALSQVLEQVDSLRGVRGITTLHDQATVSTPLQADAAVRLDNLQAILSSPNDPILAAQRGGTNDAGLTPPSTLYLATGFETMDALNVFRAWQAQGVIR